MKEWEAAKLLLNFSRSVNDANRLEGKFVPSELEKALDLAVEALELMENYGREKDLAYEEGYDNGRKAGLEEAEDEAYDKGYEDGRASLD